MKINKILSAIYGLVVLYALKFLGMEILEAGIIVLLLYEVGFEFYFIDNLMEWNNKMDQYLTKLAKKLERKLNGKAISK